MQKKLIQETRGLKCVYLDDVEKKAVLIRFSPCTAASAPEHPPLEPGAQPMYRVHGYTTAEVVKDQRFRVQEAMHKAVRRRRRRF